MRILVTVSLLVFSAAAFAQAPASPPANMGADEKKAISKACSEQANAKGLHKKDRQKFRTACKRNGGKVVAKSAPKAS